MSNNYNPKIIEDVIKIPKSILEKLYVLVCNNSYILNLLY